jgi:hypothetical protein
MAKGKASEIVSSAGERSELEWLGAAADDWTGLALRARIV